MANNNCFSQYNPIFNLNIHYPIGQKPPIASPIHLHVNLHHFNIEFHTFLSSFEHNQFTFQQSDIIICEKKSRKLGQM